MGIHELVTGLNGAGKTLYTLAEKLRPLVGTKVGGSGHEVAVRLVVGGIRDLLLPHELMEVPEIDPESFKDEWRGVLRDPGKPAVRFVVQGNDGVFVAAGEHDAHAVPLVWSILNWWAWCEPGDVIVPDECQRVFRPMASGKRVPMFLSKLETARHYGVRFVYITQHPQLIHVNVRNLVGPIEDVSRVFGGSRTLVRQWDRIGDYGKKAQATSRFWKHDKSAFGLYKSAELHTKFSQKLPLALFGVIGGLVALAVVAWVLKGRLAERFKPATPAAVSAASSAGMGATGSQSKTAGVDAGSGRWPVYVAEPAKLDREPFDGRALQYEGGYSAGSRSFGVFGIVIEGQRVATISLQQLVRMGYSWTESGPCVGVLRFGALERLVTCAKPLAVADASTGKPYSTGGPSGTPDGGRESPRGIGAQP